MPWETRFLTTYDLVSHGTSDCEASWSSATNASTGPGTVNGCVHSGSNDYSGGNTVWYNYVVASAGTIVNKNTTDAETNLTVTTESICPKGWTLPATKQIDAQRDVANFSPVRGGYYGGGSLTEESTRGRWWGSEADNDDRRFRLMFNSDTNKLATGGAVRNVGMYIRCVSEEKTATDLTYMQDMTPEIRGTIK